MAPAAHASLATGVPVYALACIDEDHVVYVGGGGAGRSGVANVVVRCAANVQSVAQLEAQDAVPSIRAVGTLALSSQEDAPMCVDVDASRAHIVCGINAPGAQMQAGTNDHVRVYTYEARDGQVRVQPKTAAPSLALKDPEHYQKTCTLSPDGRLLAVASTDGQVQLHRYPSLEPVFSPHTGVLSLGEEVYGTDFSHDSKLLAVTLASRIVLLSTTPRTVDGTTPSFLPRIVQTIAQPQIGSGLQGTFRVARFGRGPIYEGARTHALYALLHAPATKGSKARPSYVAMWDTETWSLRSSRAVSQRPATVLAVSPNGRLLAVGASDLNLTVLRALTLQPLLQVRHAHDFPPTCLAFSPRSGVLISGSADATLRMTVLPPNLVPSNCMWIY
ncbi:unnamed protein product [Malassezia sympodialis ATCC 42132]|uniref:uncharacterized protein n=1 Tax=Malassezia sympodialis (strain ATCC 42132) TaxID=1230383 RepID=UPI0002C269D5|nr:uncharacterized protein MSY001_2293 [Malassezia sympodialis ATCC 42132]CCU99587.1 unnamed protein product [Malassezia sympodialis ATCC 42132]|eukprot:XP_018740827.1 uncharacterized protein MSY001_2293 [Malassezia sympodialis ATCC 42132]